MYVLWSQYSGNYNRAMDGVRWTAVKTVVGLDSVSASGSGRIATGYYLLPSTELGLGKVKHEITKIEILWRLDYFGALLALLGESGGCDGSKRTKRGGGREGVLSLG